MSQSSALIDTLKRTLKIHGLTYLDVSIGLGLSEASVKRLFSAGGITLERMDRICSLMHMELTDLLHLHDAESHRISHLTEEQEKELAADNKLLLVGVCVRNGWSYADIVSRYVIDPNECIRYLARLERLGMIDLLPKNHIRLRVARDFRWLHNGPIERHFREQVQTDFFKSSFSKNDEVRLFLTGNLSSNSLEIILRKINSMAEEFAELHREDAQYSPDSRLNAGLLLAFRPWELPAFKAFHR